MTFLPTSAKSLSERSFAHVLAERRHRVALRRQLLGELGLLVLEDVLLQLGDVCVDFLVGDGQAQLVRLVVVLDALDEEGDRLALQRRATGRAGFG